MNGLALTVFLTAEGAASSFDVVSVMQTAVTSVQTSVFSVLGIVVPVVALIAGAVVSVKFGLKWLRQLKG